MKIAVYADAWQQAELMNEWLKDDAAVTWQSSYTNSHYEAFDAFFFLNGMPEVLSGPTNDPVLFVNRVIRPLTGDADLTRVVRMNGWPGFLQRQVWEVAGDVSEKAAEAVAILGRKLVRVDDIPGLVAARVVAAIINEAYKTRDENVSTEQEIDLALKLGTNYPYGPFEWCQKIGREQVHALLSEMASSDPKYAPFFTAKEF